MGLWSLAGASTGAQDALAELMAQQELQRKIALEESSVRQKMQDTKLDREERKRQAEQDEQFRRDALKQSGEAVTSQRELTKAQQEALAQDRSLGREYQQRQYERQLTEDERRDKDRREDNDRADARNAQMAGAMAARSGRPRVVAVDVWRDGQVWRDMRSYYPDGTMEVVSSDLKPPDAAQRGIISEMKAAVPIINEIDQLSRRINTVEEGMSAMAVGFGKKIKAKVGYEDDVNQLESMRRAYGPKFARFMGNRGALTQLEQDNPLEIFPKSTDTKQRAQMKIARLKAVAQDMVRAGVSPGMTEVDIDAMMQPRVPGPGVAPGGMEVEGLTRPQPMGTPALRLTYDPKTGGWK